MSDCANPSSLGSVKIRTPRKWFAKKSPEYDDQDANALQDEIRAGANPRVKLCENVKIIR